MLFTGSGSHQGFVAGRYRDGAYSDRWTDVLRCARQTFTAYAPACSCGWRGPLFPASDDGHLAARRVLVHEHLAAPAPRRAVRPLGGSVLA
jgi:hypothetical protein